MKVRYLIAGLLLAISCVILYLFYCSYAFVFFLRDQQIIKLHLKDHFLAPVKKELLVEVAKAPTSIKKGLAKRPRMESAAGEYIDALLFVFPKKEKYHFWMQDMLFDIDICWLDNLSISFCQKAFKPILTDQELELYTSSLPVGAVLETQPGFFDHDDRNAKLFFQW